MLTAQPPPSFAHRATRHALEAPTAYGVMGMRERARQLGGRLSITSEPGQGSCLQLLIPLELS